MSSLAYLVVARFFLQFSGDLRLQGLGMLPYVELLCCLDGSSGLDLFLVIGCLRASLCLSGLISLDVAICRPCDVIVYTLV